MRFRVSYQHDSMQCGAACLRMVCKHYGKEYALDFLSEQCGCMIDGVSLAGHPRDGGGPGIPDIRRIGRSVRIAGRMVSLYPSLGA